VGVILNKTTGSAVTVNVGNKAADSISCRKGLSEETPSKGFEKRGHGFDFPIPVIKVTQMLFLKPKRSGKFL
jgi:hypothetical protein